MTSWQRLTQKYILNIIDMYRCLNLHFMYTTRVPNHNLLLWFISYFKEWSRTVPIRGIGDKEAKLCLLFVWWVSMDWTGMVDEVSEEFGDYHVNFVHPHGPFKQFTWPVKHDACWVMWDWHTIIDIFIFKTRKYRIIDFKSVP